MNLTLNSKVTLMDKYHCFPLMGGVVTGVRDNTVTKVLVPGGENHYHWILDEADLTRFIIY